MIPLPENAPDPACDLLLERVLQAPRALVWACWTDPKHIPHWFIPKPHRVTACRIELRPGGAFDTDFDVEGQHVENRGVFLEVRPQERLVFTDVFSAGWKPSAAPFMTAILDLGDAGAGATAYRALVRHATAETAARHREMGFFDGWGTVADQLETYARGLA